MLPLILAPGAGDPCERYQIARTVRFNSPDTAYLSRTPGASGNRKTVFYSGWVKRGQLVDTALYSAGAVNNFIAIMLGHGADPYKLVVYQENGAAQVMRVVTSRLFRDGAAHCHVKVLIDTTQATAANRVRVWVDGVEETSFSTASYPALNLDTYFNHAVAHYIGHYAHNASHFGEYLLSEVRATDGVIPSVSDVGFACPSTGQWRPKEYAGTYGANGWYLDFSDNSAATSGALGKDRSGNNNDWTPVNISVAAGAGNDSLTDTPTNNFCALNPLAKDSGITLTDGNLMYTASAGGDDVFGSISLSSGKWVFEYQPSTIPTLAELGIATNADLVSDAWLGNNATYRNDGQKNVNNVISGYGAAYNTANRIRCEFDIDSNKIEFFKDGVSQGQISYTLSGKTITPVFRFGASGGTGVVFFGATGFGGTPTPDYTSICTANLPVPPVKKSLSGFVAKTDSGANIAATLATARSGWADYIEIFKRRDAAEGWRWRFSSDLTNYLDSSSTAAKAVFPALGGASYVGYALKVAAANGVATGTVAHINGVADTITDGLANSRKMVFLKREDAAGSWFVYHPDLTAGKLLYLEQVAAETTDATISSVLVSSFVAAAALASGTYRWIAIAETNGFVKLSKHIGNGAADGAFSNSGCRAQVLLSKRIDGGSEPFAIYDTARATYNQQGGTLLLNAATAEDATPSNTPDIVSNGFKARSNTSYLNTTGAIYISISFPEYPFKYANSR